MFMHCEIVCSLLMNKYKNAGFECLYPPRQPLISGLLPVAMVAVLHLYLNRLLPSKNTIKRVRV